MLNSGYVLKGTRFSNVKSEEVKQDSEKTPGFSVLVAVGIEALIIFDEQDCSRSDIHWE